MVSNNLFSIMSVEKFNLTWHTYTKHLKEMLHNIMSSNELSDITLVSEDKKQFKAHKVVLSASSQVFKTIISENVSSNPIIYLRGIQSHEIESLLQLIYLGEATFYQERMNEFLDVAKNLEIKVISKDIEPPKNEQFNDVEHQEFDQTNESPASEDLEEKNIKNNIQKQRQVTSNYDKKYPCDECSHIATTQRHLQTHIKSIHEGVKYPCDQCNLQFSDPGGMRRHKRTIHDGVRYPCDQCNYKATQLHNLNNHIKSRHP